MERTRSNDKRSQAIRVAILLALSMITVSAFPGCGSRRLKKAEEFLEAGMHKQAIVILKEEINDEPTNATAHFLLAKCELALGDTEQAEESFARAVSLSPDLGWQIGNEIMKLGRQAVKEPATHNRARYLFDLAIKYNPDLKDEIAELYLTEASYSTDHNQVPHFLQLAVSYSPNNRRPAAQVLLVKGREYFDRRQYHRAIPMLELAIKYDPALKDDVAELYLTNASASTDDDQVIDFLERAVHYNPNNCEAAAQVSLAKGREWFDNQEYQSGGYLLTLALKYNPSLNHELAKLYLSHASQFTDDNQMYDFLQVAVRYDRTHGQAAAHLLLDRSRKYFARQAYQRGLSALARAREFDRHISETGGQFLFGVLSNLPEYVPATLAQALVEESLRISPGSANQIQASVLMNVQTLLRQDKPALAISRLKSMINAAIPRRVTNEEVKHVLLRCLNELIEGETDLFRKEMEWLLKTYPQIPQSEDLMTRYLYGVYLWRFGSKNDAVAVLRTLADSTTIPCLDFVSKPIPSGIYSVNQNIEYPGYRRDRSSRGLDFSFAITSIEVPSPDVIVVNITVRNPTEKRLGFVFPRTHEEKKKQVEEARNPSSYRRDARGIRRGQITDRTTDALMAETTFYFIDQLGNKLSPKNTEPYFNDAPNWTPYFSEPPPPIGTWRIGSFHYNIIYLDPGQEIAESIIFPMIPPGSTSIRFGLPAQTRRIGFPKAVIFEPIVLRKVRFSKFPSD